MANSPQYTINIPKTDPRHSAYLTRLKTRITFAQKKQTEFIREWQDAEERTLAFLPETEYDALRRSDRERGQPKYTTIQLPYSYALLMTAHTYISSVFLGRAPVHQFAARHGEPEQRVQGLEALIGYQATVGGMLAPYYIWLYDIGKYGIGILGQYWCEETVQYSTVEAFQGDDGKWQKAQITVQEDGYKGSKVYNVAPYDFLHDVHFPIGRFQEGEFCAVHKVINWNEIIKRKTQGYYMNCDAIPKTQGAGVQAPVPGSSALIRPELPGINPTGDNFSGMGPTLPKQDHPMSVGVWEIYIELIQSEWGFGPSDFPEKWVFTVTDDFSVIIGVQPLGLAHGRFPFNVGVNEVEGYGIYGRGIPKVALPVQNTMDWLINTHFYNVRASLNNQFLIDPSKVIVTDAEDAGPGFIYRLRPEAYGSDVRSFFYQVPVQDMTKGHVNDLQLMLGLGERVMGINDQMFGAFSGGGRKTATEVRTSTGFGVNRWKTVAEYLSASAFGPHAQMLVQDTQQFYDGEQQFRIVGDLGRFSAAGPMIVTPRDIAGFYDFVPVDGTLPIDRMAMTNLWVSIMAQMQKFPALIAQFDLGKIFSYVASLGGVRNFDQFRIQVVPDGMAQMAMQAGNVVPMRQPGNSPQAGGAIPPGPPSAMMPGDEGQALDAGF